MEIGKIIEVLNSKQKTAGVFPGNIEYINLTQVEKTFLNTYNPVKSLIVYGSLAPGAPNHSVVEHINGSWLRGKVLGSLEKRGWGADLGYYGFRHTNAGAQKEIKVFVLLSDELPENWLKLDEFEGDGYRRILAKYELDNGHSGVGYIYGINEEAG